MASQFLPLNSPRRLYTDVFSLKRRLSLRLGQDLASKARQEVDATLAQEFGSVEAIKLKQTCPSLYESIVDRVTTQVTWGDRLVAFSLKV
jgi:hypothetical protein